MAVWTLGVAPHTHRVLWAISPLHDDSGGFSDRLSCNDIVLVKEKKRWVDDTAHMCSVIPRITSPYQRGAGYTLPHASSHQPVLMCCTRAVHYK